MINVDPRPREVGLVPARYIFFANVPVKTHENSAILTFGRHISMVQCLFFILKCVLAELYLLLRGSLARILLSKVFRDTLYS